MINYKNSYYVMRHGQSMVNVRKEIVSDIRNGIKPENGLSDEGRRQVFYSACQIAINLSDEALIYSSDFLRTMQTAEILADVIGVKTVETAPELRERFFGVFELKNESAYYAALKDSALVEELDTVENMESIMNRVRQLIYNLENKHTAKKIIFVAHGDTIRAIDGVLRGLSPSFADKLPMPVHGYIRSAGGVKLGRYPDAFYRVSLKAIIRNNKGEVLCAREAGGDWSLPGGGIDHEEDETVALRRELHEEVSLPSDIDFLARPVGTDSMFLYTKDAWLMWIVYEIKFEKMPAFTPGVDADEVAFLDPRIFKNSKIRTHQLIYKWCVDRSHPIRRK